MLLTLPHQVARQLHFGKDNDALAACATYLQGAQHWAAAKEVLVKLGDHAGLLDLYVK